MDMMLLSLEIAGIGIVLALAGFGLVMLILLVYDAFLQD